MNFNIKKFLGSINLIISAWFFRPWSALAVTTLPNPLGVSTPEALIARVITYVLGLVGSLALLMFIYGGIIWMTSSGAQEKVKKGKDIIVWSVIGLVVIFMAYIAVRFIIEGLSA